MHDHGASPASVLDQTPQQLDSHEGHSFLPGPHREVEGDSLQEEDTQPVAGHCIFAEHREERETDLGWVEV